MKKWLAILLMVCLVFALTGCGSKSDGSTESAEAEPLRLDKAGFNSKTNQVIEVGGYSFEIPDYYVLNEANSGEDHTDYRIANGEAIVRFATDKKSVIESDFEKAYDAFLDGMVSALGSDAKRNGNYYTTTSNGDPCSGKVEVYNNEAQGILVATIFLQKDSSSADYLPDWEKVLSSKRLLEAAEPESSESESNNADSSVLSAEFKKTMDDYEAFFDHYCEVMKKYKANPSDLSLLTEMADLLTEEQKMLDQMDSMDQSEMNAAELAYYLEVTARIEKKLIEATY